MLDGHALMTSDDRLRLGWLGVIALCAFGMGVLGGLVAFPAGLERLLGVRSSQTEIFAPQGQALIGGAFSLTDHNGRRVTDVDFRGKPLLVLFGATGDLDLTPAHLQLVAAVLNRLGPSAASVIPLFVTLDPQRDEPAVLKRFLANYHPNMLGLTGSSVEIAAIAKRYLISDVKVANSATGADPGLLSESPLFLMDRNGRFVAYLAQTETVETVAAAVLAML